MLPNRSAIITLIVSIALSIGSIWIAYNFNFLPVEASTNAPIYGELAMVLFNIGAVLFIGMVAFIVYSLIHFRRRPGDNNDGLDIEGNIVLEIFWTAVPAVIVLFIGLYSYDIYDRMGGMQPLGHSSGHEHEKMAKEERIWGGIGSGTVDSDKSNPETSLPVEVTAMQFAFLFHYPKGDIISGELHIPVNQQVSMRMESKDVIHAFWVPEFRIKQDVIPGQPTILNFTATKAGRYPIVCAELCGPYHGGMRSTVVVEDPKDYQDWFNQNSKEQISEL